MGRPFAGIPDRFGFWGGFWGICLFPGRRLTIAGGLHSLRRREIREVLDCASPLALSPRKLNTGGRIPFHVPCSPPSGQSGGGGSRTPSRFANRWGASLRRAPPEVEISRNPNHFATVLASDCHIFRPCDYAVITFRMIAGGDHFCTIDSFVNLSGSRNLEYDTGNAVQTGQ